MGTAILRGISTGLLVTLLTLLGGVLWETMGLGGIGVSSLVDIGLFLSCLIGGFRAGRDSGYWAMGAVAGIGYVGVGMLLIALFSPISGTGAMQILAEGALLGALGGVIGGGVKFNPGKSRGIRRTPREYDSYGGYQNKEYVYEDNVDVHADKTYQPLDKEWAKNQENVDVWETPRTSERVIDENIYSELELSSTILNDYEYKKRESRVNPWWEEELQDTKKIG